MSNRQENLHCLRCGQTTMFEIVVGTSTFAAWGSAHVVARGSAHVEARDSAHVEAWGSAHVVARDSAHVVARDSAHVVARDSAHVEAWGSAHVEAGPYVSILQRSSTVSCRGGTRLGHKPLSSTAWLAANGVSASRGFVTLYKRTEPRTYHTCNGVNYVPGRKVVAPDWDRKFGGECGSGLHFCATAKATKRFRDKGVFVACRVAVKDIATLPAFSQYPDKIRARACKVLYECDEDGKKVMRSGRRHRAQPHEREYVDPSTPEERGNATEPLRPNNGR